jgi:hypothetical protein
VSFYLVDAICQKHENKQRPDSTYPRLHCYTDVWGGEATVRWIGFPFIGGNSANFRSLANEFPMDWKLIAVDPLGHGQARGKLMSDVYEWKRDGQIFFTAA